MKRLLVDLTAAFGFSALMFADVAVGATVTSEAQLKAAVARAKPGATIVLKNGRYRKTIHLSGKGSAERPVTIRAESVGGVRLESKITVQGEHLVVVGFRITHNASLLVTRSKGCRISRCHMSNVQAAQWVYVDERSRGIEIDHCLFEDKQNNRRLPKGAQLMRLILTNSKEAHRVHHNHFRNIPKGSTGNGFETLQLMTRGNPKNPRGGDTGNFIAFNLFENCDGESEIISVKSNGNILRGNTFCGSRGGLVLRHGHRNLVDGNWFLGAGKSGAAGVRMQGADHVIINNLFLGLPGSAVAMMDGTPDDLYVRVERALIAHNTFVNCGQHIAVGLNHSKHPDGTVPRDCVVANNILFNRKPDRPLIGFVRNQTPQAWTWRKNLFKGRLGVPGRPGLEDRDAHLRFDDQGVPVPTAQTPSGPRPTTKLKAIAKDLFGRQRPANATLGAVQFADRMSIGRPLGPNDVGPKARK